MDEPSVPRSSRPPSISAAAPAAAAPDNDRTLHFELTCADGNVYQASLAASSPTACRGSPEPTVTCTYTGAVSGNAYTRHRLLPEK